MNVQFNKNAAASLPQSQSSNSVGLQASSSSHVNPAPKLFTEKQLQKAEMQGANLSIGEEQVVRAIDRAIKALEGPSTKFEMQMHEQTKTIMVKVINKDTGELIREIPPEKTLDLVAKMMEFAGLLIDEKV